MAHIRCSIIHGPYHMAHESLYKIVVSAGPLWIQKVSLRAKVGNYVFLPLRIKISVLEFPCQQRIRRHLFDFGLVRFRSVTRLESLILEDVI